MVNSVLAREIHLGLLSVYNLLINYTISFNLHFCLHAPFTVRAQGGSRKLSQLQEEAEPVSSQTVQLFPFCRVICPTNGSREDKTLSLRPWRQSGAS